MYGINFLPFNMTASLQQLLTLTYDSKEEAALLNYFHTPLYTLSRAQNNQHRLGHDPKYALTALQPTTVSTNLN